MTKKANSRNETVRPGRPAARQLSSLLLASALALSVGSSRHAGAQHVEGPAEPVVGLPCEGCEAVFQGLPETLEWSSRIAPIGEPGEPMRIEGTVRNGDGGVAPGVIVYAYQTDSQGLYPPDEQFRGLAAGRHGRLRGWALTDAEGRYAFDTIRPAGYPGTDLPQHVHMHVLEFGRCTYYIDDILFDDDPRLTRASRGGLSPGRGGNGVVEPERDSSGTWVVRRDIVLGAEIPGYPEHE